MVTRFQTTLIVGFIGAVWAIALVLSGLYVDASYWKPFGIVVSASFLASLLFDRYALNFQFLQGTLVTTPDLRGSWRMHLVSTWSASGGAPTNVILYVFVDQTLNTLKVTALGPNGQSHWMTSKIKPSAATSGYHVMAMYSYDQAPPTAGMSAPNHTGAVSLETTPAHGKPNMLTGTYWTSGKNAGTVEMLDRRDVPCTTYAEAAAAYANSSP